MELQRILELCNDLNIKVRSYNSIDVRVHCPFAPWKHAGGVDRVPDMYIKVEEDNVSVFHCFACGSKGLIRHLIASLAYYRKQDYRDLLIKYHEEPKVRVFDYREISLAESKEDEEFFIFRLPAERRPELVELHEWLDRGISREVIERFKVRYDKKHDRIFFPLYSIEGKLVSAYGRCGFLDRNPKYLNYREGFSCSNYFFGEQFFEKSLGYLILVEGQFDVLRMVDYGYKNVIGIMGHNPDLSKFIEYIDKIYIVFDNDKAGRKKAYQVAEKYYKDLIVKIVQLPENKDPCDCSKEEIELSIKNSKIFGIKHLTII